MFDIGFWDLVILFGLGLVILGPERLPRVAQKAGNWAGQARRMARTLTTQMREELDDINKPFTADTTKNTSAAGSEVADNESGADEDAVKTPDDVPTWQTSAGLRPDMESADEAALNEVAGKKDADTDPNKPT